GWKKGMEVPTDIAIAYLLQCSFYGHSIYATAYMDTWRKDSVVMLLHHVVTLTLIASSYAFSRDCQVQGELARAGRRQEVVLGEALLGLALSPRAFNPSLPLCPGRFWFRLYWFPLKVLYATCHSSLQAVPDIPFYFFFNALLLILTLMNIYWFLYIVLFVAKVLMGQMQEVTDVREYDAEESRKA
ncbi:CERS1 synthase, partial [Tricholaema leucomelas]|nr:CERS1 synthase [Tricholaema leucomelas]